MNTSALGFDSRPGVDVGFRARRLSRRTEAIDDGDSPYDLPDPDDDDVVEVDVDAEDAETEVVVPTGSETYCDAVYVVTRENTTGFDVKITPPAGGIAGYTGLSYFALKELGASVTLVYVCASGEWRVISTSGDVDVVSGVSTANLIAYYSFDADDGTDDSGNGRTATVGSNVTWSAGKFSRAANATGGSQDGNRYVHRDSDAAAFSLGSGDFTLTAWVNLSSLQVGEKGILCIVGATSFTAIGIKHSGNSVVAVKSDVAQITAGHLSTGTWHHVALRRSGGTLELFQDGSSVGSTAIAGSLEAAYATVSLAMLSRYLGQELLAGGVCDCAVFSRALTNDELAILGSGNRVIP